MFKRIPDCEYHSIDAFSSSGCKSILKTPAHFKALYIDKKFKRETEAMKLGTLVHTVVLDKRINDLVLKPKIDMRRKGAKEEMDSFYSSLSRSALAVTEDEFATVAGIYESIMNNKWCFDHLASGLVEHCGLYTDTEHGVKVKFKPDLISTEGKYILDIKTCQDAGTRSFQRSAIDYGYDIQAYHYLSSTIEMLEAKMHNFFFVCVEKEPPYAVKTYRAGDDLLTSGKRKYQQGIGMYARCLLTNEWPGYPSEPETINPPPWSL